MNDIKGRVFAAYEHLKNIGKVKNLVEFAEVIGTNKAGISDIKADRKKISLENLMLLTDFYADFDLYWLSKGIGSMIKSYSNNQVSNIASEPSMVIDRMPKVVTIDSAGHENVPLVPVKAAAGYLNGYADPEYIGNLPTYSLPNIQNGTFRMFQVKGDSMMPSLHDKSMVVGQFVEDWVKGIKDDRVYIIVSKEEGIIVKRCLNKIKKYNNLLCKSDNRKDYPDTIILQPEDIIEVWEYKMHLSYNLPNPTDLYDRVSELEANMAIFKSFITKNNIKN